jgi:hypothetical protein
MSLRIDRSTPAQALIRHAVGSGLDLVAPCLVQHDLAPVGVDVRVAPPQDLLQRALDVRYVRAGLRALDDDAHPLALRAEGRFGEAAADAVADVSLVERVQKV